MLKIVDDDAIPEIESPTETMCVPIVVADESTGRHQAEARLVCVAGAELGRTFRISATPLVIGRGPCDLVLHATDVSRTHARVVQSGRDHVIEDLRSSNGTFVNGVEVRGKVPLRVGDRVQIGSTIFVFAYHDELEARMRQLQRLEAMGELAGGLAHDFNNALMVILTNLQLLEEDLPPEARSSFQLVHDMKDAASSASRLARQLLRLGRSDASAFETIEVAPLIERSAAMMRRQGGTKIGVVASVAPDLAVRGSPDELYQVLLNLFVNARDAMPDGGTLRIVARGIDLDPSQALSSHVQGDGKYVELAVTDTGHGMDEATLARAFDPFFTTKPIGKGTGLGLSMIHSIVRKHGGNVVAESAPGRGTTFRIVLPRL